MPGGLARQRLTPEQVEAGRLLGALLCDARAGRDRAEVAHAAGISPETPCKIETGRLPSPGSGTIVRLGEALNVPVQELAATWRGSDLLLGAVGQRLHWSHPSRGVLSVPTARPAEPGCSTRPGPSRLPLPGADAGAAA